MRITDPEIIKTGEMDLINSVKDDLDWDVVKSIIKNRLNIKAFDSNGGEIVVVDGKIAFRIDLELKMSVSLMFDRDGNYIDGDDTSPDIDFSEDLDFLQKAGETEQKVDQTERVESDKSVQLEMETQVEKNDLEFGLPDFNEELDSSGENDTLDDTLDDDIENDIDDDIDDILEETRELWKKKKE